MTSKDDSAGTRKPGSQVGNAYVFEALEPRVLLSADPLGVAVGDALHEGELDGLLPEEFTAPETVDALIETSAATLDLTDKTTSEPSSIMYGQDMGPPG